MALIYRMEQDPEIDLTVIMGSGLIDSEFGKGSDYVVENHPGVTFHKLKYTKRENNNSRSSLIAGEIADGMAKFLLGKTFDGVIVVADRFETLPAAMVASYMNFIVLHIQGGEVTGNIDERVRHSVTKLSDYHFTSTKLGLQYLIEMGEERNSVFRTGCPSIDIVKEMGIRRKIPKKKYMLCVFHPDTESIETQYEETKEVLNAVLDICLANGIVCHWYWPNPDPGREEIIKLLEVAHKEYSKFLVKAVNKRPFEFLRELSMARIVVGNSSVALRECSYLGVPTVNIGHRQNVRERSWNVIDCPPKKESILVAMEEQLKARRYRTSYLFGDGKASYKILKYLKNLELAKKGSLTYPLRPKYMEEHLGETRFRKHKTNNFGPTPKIYPNTASVQSSAL